MIKKGWNYQKKMNDTIKLLNELRKERPFRVAEGKSKWYQYERDMPIEKYWNVREILSNEIVIEFDMPKDFEGSIKDFQDISFEATNFTGINLSNAGIEFEVWDHKGKSPHIHIRNLPIAHLEKDKLKLFKKMFLKKYVPIEYHKYMDFSLCGTHLIAIEGVFHWKGKYDVKRLIHKFEKEDNNNEYRN